MIEVGVRVEDDLDLRNVEAKGTDVLQNPRSRGRQTPVNQRVSVGGSDQHRGEPLRTDVVRVPEDLERALGCIPLRATRANVRRIALGQRVTRRQRAAPPEENQVYTEKAGEDMTCAHDRDLT